MAREVSSLHVLFPRPEEAMLLEASGLMLRRTVQFHWRNEGYADFEDFLGRMTAHRRTGTGTARRHG